MASQKRSFRYTFGLDDPFLGSLQVEQVAPLSSSFSSELDPMDAYVLGKENYVAPPQLHSSPFRDRCISKLTKPTCPPLEDRCPTVSVNTNFFIAPPNFSRISHPDDCRQTPAFSEPYNAFPSSPFRKEDDNPFISSAAIEPVPYFASEEDAASRNLKRARILSNDDRLSGVALIDIFTASSDLLSCLATPESDPVACRTSSVDDELLASSLSRNVCSLDWLDDGILQTEILLQDDPHDEEIIKFSSSFIDNFIENIERVFQDSEGDPRCLHEPSQSP